MTRDRWWNLEEAANEADEANEAGSSQAETEAEESEAATERNRLATPSLRVFQSI